MTYFKKLLVCSFTSLVVFSISEVILEGISDILGGDKGFVSSHYKGFMGILSFFLMSILYGGLFIAFAVFFLYNKSKKQFGFSPWAAVITVSVLVLLAALFFFSNYPVIRFEEIISFVQTYLVALGVIYLNEKFLEPLNTVDK